ncbi:MAG: 50S ribosome-binding GTPase [Propioniciclava sp.]|uniref:GTPase n=1 Tax=Propioniciclava sp. TaxID=2038686 RepID=UPI0039E31608
MKDDRRKQPSLAARLKYLDDAIDLARGRAPESVIEATDALIERAGERLSIAGEHTVVALAGATGSGKSSTLNAVTGTQLATAGVTRPTTSEAMAVSWGTELPAELLDWLGVRRRHLIATGDGALRDLVLLDLPDHDSTEVAHRLTVDRLVEQVDMMVWIVDPQKYADAALHDGYLKPLASHADIMVVVLNQADRLTPDARAAALADLRRLLDSEGLGAVRVLAMSAVTGEGVPEFRAVLEAAARAKAASRMRFAADVTRQAGLLAGELGSGPIPVLDEASLEGVYASMAQAASVPVVVDGVRDAWQHRGALATGWPMVSWVKRLKPDPLKRLRMGLAPTALSPTEVSRTSLPKATSVQRAKLDASVRGVIETATAGLPRGWADRIRAVARGNDARVIDRLDRAVASTDLKMDAGHGWWIVVTILQWLLFAALVAGGVWLLLPALLALAQVPVELPLLLWFGWPAQLVLVAGGVAGGVLVALLSRVFVNAGAAVKARSARRALMTSVTEVADEEIVEPVRAELERLAAAREAVAKAR